MAGSRVSGAQQSGWTTAAYCFVAAVVLTPIAVAAGVVIVLDSFKQRRPVIGHYQTPYYVR